MSNFLILREKYKFITNNTDMINKNVKTTFVIDMEGII